MSFNTKAHKTHKDPGSSPIQTVTVPVARTHKGGLGYTTDAKSELFLVAVSNFFGRDTFYESGNAQATRFVDLVHAVAGQDPVWMLDFVSWLRNAANMRSSSIVAALETVKALLTTPDLPKVPGSKVGLLRLMVRTGIVRADESGEAIAYWTSRYGRSLPQPVKRGVADALNSLNEYGALKYNSDNDAFKLADVLQLVHAKGKDAHQNDLFGFILANRYGYTPAPDTLPQIQAREKIIAIPVTDRRAWISEPNASRRLKDAGMTWEALAGWLQGPMDAAAWEAIIPSMGYMALLRNLRNFDEAGISNAVAATVAEKLASPVEVAKSRQLPLRFLSAYRAAPSLRWGHALSQALDSSLLNIPALPGRTLVLVDTSSSMNMNMSDKSQLKRWDAAAQFGVALARVSPGVELWSYSSSSDWSVHRVTTKQFYVRPGAPVLSELARWINEGYNIGGSTPTTDALRARFNGHDRVILITDGQPDGSQRPVESAIPADVPMYIFDIGSYRSRQMASGPNRHILTGLTDHMFKLIPLIEAGQRADWPWVPSN